MPHGPRLVVLHMLFLFYVKQLQFARLQASSAFIVTFIKNKMEHGIKKAASNLTTLKQERPPLF